MPVPLATLEVGGPRVVVQLAAGVGREVGGWEAAGSGAEARRGWHLGFMGDRISRIYRILADRAAGADGST